MSAASRTFFKINRQSQVKSNKLNSKLKQTVDENHKFLPHCLSLPPARKIISPNFGGRKTRFPLQRQQQRIPIFIPLILQSGRLKQRLRKLKKESKVKGVILWKPEEAELAGRLALDYNLHELMNILETAVFQRSVTFRANTTGNVHCGELSLTSPETATITQPVESKTTARDLLVLLTAISTKSIRHRSFLAPACEALAALSSDLTLSELLQLLDVLTNLHLCHIPLATSISYSIQKHLSSPPWELIPDCNDVSYNKKDERKMVLDSATSRIIQPYLMHKPTDEKECKKYSKAGVTTICAFRVDDDFCFLGTDEQCWSPNELTELLKLSRSIYKGLATQRLRDVPLLNRIDHLIKRGLRRTSWDAESREVKKLAGGHLAWNFSHLAKLDRFQEINYAAVMNEHLRAFAKDSLLDLTALTLWGEGLFISALDRHPKYLETIVEIAIRLGHMIEAVPFSAFLDLPKNDPHSPPSSKKRCGRNLLIRLQHFIFGFRYFHFDVFDQLSEETKNNLVRIQNFDPPIQNKPLLAMQIKMSSLLRRLRIAHTMGISKGPVLADIVERDRNLVWTCGTITSYYANCRERTTVFRFKQRLLQAMGYNVATVAFWHWSRMSARRTRLEYLRMARYYALRDRREFEPDFEGWNLPHLGLSSRRAHSVQAKGKYFPNYEPLGYKNY